MTTTEDEPSVGDGTMSLTEHLAELRVRIIRASLAVVLGMVIIIALYEPILDVLLEPYQRLCDREGPAFCDPNVFAFGPTEGFQARLRFGMYGGIIVALPVILWQVWRFVVPALHAKEKRYAIPFVVSSVVLFVAGGVLAYFTVERALEFLIRWSGSEVTQAFAVQKYISLIGLMIFAFGVGFLLPVLLVFLQLVGVVTPRRLLQSWRYAIVAIFALAAVITPSGDPVTLMMLGLPMLTLYFVAVLIGWLVLRRRTPA